MLILARGSFVPRFFRLSLDMTSRLQHLSPNWRIRSSCKEIAIMALLSGDILVWLYLLRSSDGRQSDSFDPEPKVRFLSQVISSFPRKSNCSEQAGTMLQVASLLLALRSASPDAGSIYRFQPLIHSNSKSVIRSSMHLVLPPSSQPLLLIVMHRVTRLV